MTDRQNGRDAGRDNVFVKPLWRSVKYERGYLRAYKSVSAARADFANYVNWHNAHRPHSKLNRLTSPAKYLAGLPLMTLAA